MESLSQVLQVADLGKQRGGSFLFLHRCAYNIAPHIHLRTYIDTALSLHSHFIRREPIGVLPRRRSLFVLQ